MLQRAAGRVNRHFGGLEEEQDPMSRLLSRSIRAGSAAGLCFALLAAPALAVERHKSIEAEPGKTVRVSNHIHFKASTCEAISIPQIVIRKKPTKGKLAVVEDVVPLGNSRSERGERCIGKPMRAAIVRYTPFANAKGDDTLAYDVIYPRSCTNCRNYEVSVAVSIEGELAEPARAAPREAATPPRDARAARAAPKAPRPADIARAPVEVSRPGETASAEAGSDASETIE
jgi:hypothetical protein